MALFSSAYCSSFLVPSSVENPTSWEVSSLFLPSPTQPFTCILCGVPVYKSTFSQVQCRLVIGFEGGCARGYRRCSRVPEAEKPSKSRHLRKWVTWRPLSAEPAKTSFQGCHHEGCISLHILHHVIFLLAKFTRALAAFNELRICGCIYYILWFVMKT